MTNRARLLDACTWLAVELFYLVTFGLGTLVTGRLLKRDFVGSDPAPS